MSVRNITAILFSIPLLCAASAAHAISLQTLSDQELAANVTGVSVLISFRNQTENNQAGTFGIGGSEFGNFVGIQTISTNMGSNTISQAATSLAVRATLTEGAHQTVSAGF
jgi:hypothetical protein